MKKKIAKLVYVFLVLIFLLGTLPNYAKAAEEEIEGIVLEKESGEKIIYIKGMNEKEFKFAFSNEELEDSEIEFVTAVKDARDEYVAYIEAEETYKYMFIQNENKINKIEFNSLKNITDEEIKSLQNLTKIINIKSNESNVKIEKEDDTVITKTRGKIVITDIGKYKYELIEIVDKNNSTEKIDETASKLYESILKLENTEKMYDKLENYVTIRDNYNKLLENAKWKDAENKEIMQPEDSQEGEKFIVLIQEIKDDKVEREDIQIMTCDREDDADVEYTEKQEVKVVEKRTALPVTGENLILYIAFGVVIVAIIILCIKMKKSEKDSKHEK